MYKIEKDIVGRVEGILSEEIDRIDKQLSIKDEVREKIIKITREIIRNSSNCISNIHLGKLTEAEQLLDKLHQQVTTLKEATREHQDLYHSGTVYNALSEYVECLSLYYILTGKGIPRQSKLNIPIPPYLQGLGDLIGELRRTTLETLRKNKIKQAQILLDTMETIYHKLKTLHYPDALTPGLRHKTDVARRLIEDTKALIIDIANRRKLEKTIKEYINKTQKQQKKTQ